MKRFLVFYGCNYYPCGGMDDFLKDFDTIEECKNAINNKIDQDYWDYNWAHIFDTETREQVWSK